MEDDMAIECIIMEKVMLETMQTITEVFSHRHRKSLFDSCTTVTIFLL